MDYLDLLQWPAGAMTIGGAWMIGSLRRHLRNIGFGVSFASNFVWIVWAWHVHAPAVVLLQIGLAAMNVRGMREIEQAQQR
jgi:hypothetical protein